MEGDLRKLIDDPRFRAWWESLEPKFNTFDVLRYADYEIRHSNVLAWLLRSADTHGLGERFLEWFVNHVRERFPEVSGGHLPPTDSEAANVVVRRELDYVDITIFFRTEKIVIAIENKPEPASHAHFDQIRGYVEKLRVKYDDHTIRGVLLTTSPDGSVDIPPMAFPDITHVSWKSVHEQIGSLHKKGKFHSNDVKAFVSQYRTLVEKWFGPAGNEGFKALLDDHGSILTEMRKVLDAGGDSAVRERVPADRTCYSEALVRLVHQSRQDPKELRQAVADRLKGRGRELHFTHNATQGVYWLNWRDADLADVARRLGCGDFFLSWGMEFAHHTVRMRFYLYQTKAEEQDPLDRLKRFMQATPINRRKPDEYPMRGSGFGWYRVYDHGILSEDDLSAMSAHEVKDEVIRWLVDFMESDESERRRIDDYFQCLAFRSDDSASTRAGSS